MEINTTVALFAAQIISSLGLFWAVTNSFNNRINDVESKMNAKFEGLSREINEMKVEQAKIEGRLSSLEQTVRYILDCFPKPKIAIQVPQD
jgi:hypothetical protein